MKQAGAYTDDLVGLSANGTHVPSGTIEVLDSLGAATLRVRLIDIVIASDHLALSSARDALEQQRLSQLDALTALTTNYQQAQRDLETAEELGKSRVMTRLDLARARERASELQQRISLARQRQGLLERQLAVQGGVDESLLLRCSRVEIETPQAGGQGTEQVRAPT